jgi:hypothetical protein
MTSHTHYSCTVLDVPFSKLPSLHKQTAMGHNNDEIQKIFKDISIERSYDLQIFYVVFTYIDTVTAKLYSFTLKHTTNKLILSPYPRYAEEFTGNLYICDNMEFPVMCNLCFIKYLWGGQRSWIKVSGV